MGYGTLDSLVESLLERIKLLENRIEKLENNFVCIKYINVDGIPEVHHKNNLKEAT